MKYKVRISFLFLGLTLPIAQAQGSDQSLANQFQDALKVVSGIYYQPVAETQLLSGCSEELIRGGNPARPASSVGDLSRLAQELSTANPAQFTETSLRDLCFKGMFSRLDKQSAYLNEAELNRLRNEAAGPAKPVQAYQIEGRFLYIRIEQFQEKTVGELADVLKRANAQPIRPAAFVLDLRDCPGGLLTTSIGVAAAFLPKGSIVFATKGHHPDASQTLLALPEYYALYEKKTEPLQDLPQEARTVPLAVLVNHKTASGAEAVAGALQFHRRADIVGEQTAGVGMIQTFRPLLNQTMFKLTSAQIILPSGRELEANGIAPNLSAGSDEASKAALDHLKAIPLN